MSGEPASAPRVNYDDLELDDQLALRDGVPFTGIVYSERPDGSLEAEGRYRDGLPDGVQEQFYPGGRIERRWTAVRGDGPSEDLSWYPDGQPRSVERYVDQRRVEAQAWDRAGKPIDPDALDATNAFGQAVAGAS